MKDLLTEPLLQWWGYNDLLHEKKSLNFILRDAICLLSKSNIRKLILSVMKGIIYEYVSAISQFDLVYVLYHLNMSNYVLYCMQSGVVFIFK